MTTVGELFSQETRGGIGALPVAGVTADSRQVKPGFVFFAVAGAKADGMKFAEAAVHAGAIAVVAEGDAGDVIGGAPVIGVADVRAALSHAAAKIYPRQPGTVVAITGTSGKTSTAAFTRQIYSRLGRAAAALGTTGVVKPSGETYGSLTTPDPVTLHRTLDELAAEGVTHLAMEASSHGLDQRRLDGVRLAAAAFTNLSRDHLDYHPTAAHYLAAKMRLFDTLLPRGAPVVIDADSDVATQVRAVCEAHGHRVLAVGRRGDGIALTQIRADADAMRIEVRHADVNYAVRLPLSGEFMASNALVAAGLCISTGEAPAQVFAALETLSGAPGRLERVGERLGAPIFVDYAHKPDALEKVLGALRPIASGRLIVVFGCGGDRDVGKRPIMGEIAARCADVVFITDDNPRSENPAAIRAAILAAAPGAIEIGDRAGAITQAVGALRAGDALVVAGKGHESGQIVGDTVLPFSDRDAVLSALQEIGA